MTAVIIIGLILFFGYKWIGDIIEQADTVAKVQFQKELTKEINKVKTRYGSWENLELTVPSSIDRVCFFEFSDSINFETQGICQQGHKDYIAYMYNYWESKVANIMTQPPLEELDIQVGDIIMGDGNDQFYICFDNDHGRIKLRLEGLGDATRVSSW